MARPSLSVVVPAHNESAYIGPCLEALLDQKESVDEIVVVDNGSTDDTAAIVRSYATDNPSIRLVSESRLGLAQARNTGFDEASGEIIGRIDADTRVRPEWGQVIRDFFAESSHDEVGAITGLNNSYDSPFGRIEDWAIRRQIRRGNMGNERRVVNTHGANCALRATTWSKIRDQVSLRRDILEDLDVAICIANTGEFIVQPSDLWADISPRRALTDPITYFRTYSLAAVRTARLHEMTGYRNWPAIGRGIAVFWLAHLVNWLPHRAWDPQSARFSLRRMVRPGLTTPLSVVPPD